jgi:foldase protein PrsA
MNLLIIVPKISVILTDTKEKADQIKARLGKGEDFKEVAKTDSIQEQTKTNGGYIGWVNENGNIPFLGDTPELMGIIFKLKKDQISDPIKTAKGFTS